MIENNAVMENNYPPFLSFLLYTVAMKIRAMKINHARKRYFEMPYLNMLMRGQLKRMIPRAKRNIQISLFIAQYYNKMEL